ncbi:MAG: type II toxin-antitoxin system VapC family toxin [Thermoleophilaceae bacterium]|nr:type II toxin-antitoxin system VapC family toxin [Thermoleophilaceae bacterium]
MIVVDASAVVDFVLRTARSDTVEGYLFADAASLHAPELLDYEILSALRRWERRGELDVDLAEGALVDSRTLPISLYPVRPLVDRAWALRENLTPADALYAALAETLGAPLLTTRRRPRPRRHPTHPR